ncbi:MAG: globin domain-containing protein [Candidatus Dormibacteria bacterium]
MTLFDRVGGSSWFVALVDRFYAAVEQDPLLRPLYPADLGPARVHLALFLAQYWGGPPEYQAFRGHPRLRRRHAPFAIRGAERDAWMVHMRAAVRSGQLSASDEAEVLAYFESAASALINRPSWPPA